MSKQFIADVIQRSVGCTGVKAVETAGVLVDSIVTQIKREGGFTLPSFGTFTLRKTKARTAMNPKTQEPVKVPANRTVRFKCSPSLKILVGGVARKAAPAAAQAKPGKTAKGSAKPGKAKTSRRAA